MEPVYVKKALYLFDRVHFYAIQNEGDGDLQHTIEGIINMVEGIAIRSKKIYNSFEFFSSLRVFNNMLMLYSSSRVKSVLILNIAYSRYFLTLFVRKCLQILIEQRKK